MANSRFLLNNLNNEVDVIQEQILSLETQQGNFVNPYSSNIVLTNTGISGISTLTGNASSAIGVSSALSMGGNAITNVGGLNSTSLSATSVSATNVSFAADQAHPQTLPYRNLDVQTLTSTGESVVITKTGDHSYNLESVGTDNGIISVSASNNFITASTVNHAVGVGLNVGNPASNGQILTGQTNGALSWTTPTSGIVSVSSSSPYITTSTTENNATIGFNVGNPTQNNQVLTGQTNGALSWTTPTSGGITTVSAGNFLTPTTLLGAVNIGLNASPSYSVGQVLTVKDNTGFLEFQTPTSGWVGTATTDLNMNNNSITNANKTTTTNLELKQAGGGNIKFPDATVQATAYTGQFIPTATTDLNMNNNAITNAIRTTTKSLELTQGGFGNIMFQDGTIQNTAPVSTFIGTATTGLNMNLFSISNATNFELTQGGGGNIKFQDGTIQSTAPVSTWVGTATSPLNMNNNSIFNALKTTTTNLELTQDGGGNIKFPDGTTQSTAASTNAWVGTATSNLNMNNYAITNALKATTTNLELTQNAGGNIKFQDGTTQSTAAVSNSWIGTATSNLNMGVYNILQSTGKITTPFVNGVIGGVSPNKTSQLVLNDGTNDDASFTKQNFMTFYNAQNGAGSAIALTHKNKVDVGGQELIISDTGINIIGNLGLNNSSITGVNKTTTTNLELTQGGGGNIKFPDGTTQNTAAVSSWVGTATSDLNMNSNSITNALKTTTTNLELTQGGSGNIKFQDGSTQSIAYTGQFIPTATTTLNMNNHSISNALMNNPFITQPLSNGQVLASTTTGSLSWATPNVGTLTGITAGTNISVSGSAPSPTVNLNITGDLNMNSHAITNALKTTTTNLELTQGGGGNIKFQDGTTQSIAYTGQFIPTATTTLNMNSHAITNALKTTTTNLELTQGGGGNIKFQDGTTQSTAPTFISTATTTLNMNSHAITNALKTTTTNLELTQGGGGNIKFQDGTIQTTAPVSTWVGTATSPLNMNGYDILNTIKITGVKNLYPNYNLYITDGTENDASYNTYNTISFSNNGGNDSNIYLINTDRDGYEHGCIVDKDGLSIVGKLTLFNNPIIGATMTNPFNIQPSVNGQYLTSTTAGVLSWTSPILPKLITSIPLPEPVGFNYMLTTLTVLSDFTGQPPYRPAEVVFTPLTTKVLVSATMYTENGSSQSDIITYELSRQYTGGSLQIVKTFYETTQNSASQHKFFNTVSIPDTITTGTQITYMLKCKSNNGTHVLLNDWNFNVQYDL